MKQSLAIVLSIGLLSSAALGLSQLEATLKENLASARKSGNVLQQHKANEAILNYCQKKSAKVEVKNIIGPSVAERCMGELQGQPRIHPINPAEKQVG